MATRWYKVLTLILFVPMILNIVGCSAFQADIGKVAAADVPREKPQV